MHKVDLFAQNNCTLEQYGWVISELLSVLLNFIARKDSKRKAQKMCLIVSQGKYETLLKRSTYL